MARVAAPTTPASLWSFAGRTCKPSLAAVKGEAADAGVDAVQELRQALHHAPAQDQAAGVKGVDQAHRPGDQGPGHLIHQEPGQGVLSPGRRRPPPWR